MSTTLQQALLSFPSYARLTTGGSEEALRDQLTNAQQGAGMTAAQAELFASQFEVVDQYDGTPFVDQAAGVSFTSILPTGLSATVFKRRGIDAGEAR